MTLKASDFLPGGPPPRLEGRAVVHRSVEDRAPAPPPAPGRRGRKPSFPPARFVRALRAGAALGEFSAGELAARLGVRHRTAATYLVALRQIGLVRKVGERPAGRRPEFVYVVERAP